MSRGDSHRDTDARKGDIRDMWCVVTDTEKCYIFMNLGTDISLH